ncbi:MAG: hypothetical protein FJY76_03115 [Candidatus Aenigmarchaeota archaeon]|nr:hypothetical protein [Candidatus Aenigmarchaeota archaeon]
MAIERVLVPYSFLGFDTVVYLIAAVIGFMVAYNASKIYAVSSKRSHMYLCHGFTILSIGFLILAISSGYTYMNMHFSNQYTELPLFQPSFDVYDFGYWIYYAASVVAYVMLIMMYLPGSAKSSNKLFFILPYWFVAFPFFHLISILLIAYVAFKSAANYFDKRTRGAFFVMGAFSAFALFHLLMLFASFSKVIYVVAHVFLILGALSLLMVLTRAGRRRLT